VAARFGMKNEDDNAEATRVCNVMRSIGEEVGALLAPVHHYSKNPGSGLRGASAWRGSVKIVEDVLADNDPLTGRAAPTHPMAAGLQARIISKLPSNP
jgi:hypothetical protein